MQSTVLKEASAVGDASTNLTRKLSAMPGPMGVSLVTSVRATSGALENSAAPKSPHDVPISAPFLLLILPFGGLHGCCDIGTVACEPWAVTVRMAGLRLGAALQASLIIVKPFAAQPTS